MATQLNYLNLTLSSRCSLNCVFCPNRKQPRRETVTDMTPATADRVLARCAGRTLRRIDVGETGDAFINADTLDILRCIRRHQPDAAIRIFTNFQTFDPARIERVIAERLIDQVITNMDGATPATYRAVKRGNFERAVANIETFLEIQQHSPHPPTFRMQSLTLHHYVRAVRHNLGRDPRHVAPERCNAADDFADIQARWEPAGVSPVRSFITLWAEAPATVRPRTLRAWWRHARRGQRCRLLPRLAESLFVAPDGMTYLCCADFDFELQTGNLLDTEIGNVLDGPVRQGMLDRIARGRFEDVGGPCRHFPLCQAF